MPFGTLRVTLGHQAMSTPKKPVIFELEPRVNEDLGEDARVSGEFAGVLPRAKCPKCRGAQVTDPFAPPVRRVYLDRRGMAFGSHLFRVVNASGSLLLSDTLAKALRELKPSGLRLPEAGEWV